MLFQEHLLGRVSASFQQQTRVAFETSRCNPSTQEAVALLLLLKRNLLATSIVFPWHMLHQNQMTVVVNLLISEVQ
jgi:hypothetical protein